MATYPNAIANFLTLVDGVDTIIAAHPNDRAAEITAIETELGTSPKGSCSDVKTRLAVSLNNDGTIKSNIIAQGMLKASIGEVSTNSPGTDVTLPGGTYGFYVQVKTSGGTSVMVNFTSSAVNVGTSYLTLVGISANGSTTYVQQRYITASGRDHWVFLLIDKRTKKIITSYQAPDHPSANTVCSELEIPHPFRDYDPALHEIVVADNEFLKSSREKISRRRSLLTVINEDFIIDDTKRPAYEPREIIKINEFPKEPVGKVIATIKTPDWAKIMIRADEINLEQTIIEKLPDDILYKQLAEVK